MKVSVFVPTYRMGGLDVLEASLARQTYKNIELIIGDELYWQRVDVWYDILDRLDIDWSISVLPQKKEGYRRNLCASYNEAADICVRRGRDLMISLQDYIWIPPDGVQRFVDLADNSPDDLYTGLTSISKDPFPSSKSENFYYSIFDQPYYDKPEDIDWLDCRIDGVYEYHPDEDEFMQIIPEHWEANWAAIPVNFFRIGIRWDEEFDRGVAYENMDFAKAAIAKTDRRVIMDTKNHAISLPHKDYFAGEREEIIRYSNKRRYEERWGPS